MDTLTKEEIEVCIVLIEQVLPTLPKDRLGAAQDLTLTLALNKLRAAVGEYRKLK